MALCSLVVASGCGKGSASAARDNRAFETASAEDKQMWQTALEATRTNDFSGAKTLLYTLGSSQLTPDQKEAVKHALASLDEKFSEALKKGDPAAQQALDALHQNPPNRGR